MTPSIRPMATFVLRLWREPGDPQTDAGWRGLIRPLGADAASAGENKVAFHGLHNLADALRPLLEESPTKT